MVYGQRSIVNARIESTMLGFEDHGILTLCLTLDYGGSGQGFGLVMLGGVQPDEVPYASHLIHRILRVVGAEKWEDLKGKHIRADQDNSKVYRIGNIIKDEWCDPQEIFDSLLEVKQDANDLH